MGENNYARRIMQFDIILSTLGKKCPKKLLFLYLPQSSFTYWNGAVKSNEVDKVCACLCSSKIILYTVTFLASKGAEDAQGLVRWVW